MSLATYCLQEKWTETEDGIRFGASAMRVDNVVGIRLENVYDSSKSPSIEPIPIVKIRVVFTRIDAGIVNEFAREYPVSEKDVAYNLYDDVVEHLKTNSYYYVSCGGK